MLLDTTAVVQGIHDARDKGKIHCDQHSDLVGAIYAISAISDVGRCVCDYQGFLNVIGDVTSSWEYWSVYGLWSYLGKCIASGISVGDQQSHKNDD